MIAPKPSPAFPHGRLSGWVRLTFWFASYGWRIVWDAAMVFAVIYLASVVASQGRSLDALENRYLKVPKAGD